MNNRNWLSLIIAAAIALTGSIVAHADGSHGSKITITHVGGEKIRVFTYNGNDSACQIPHKTYTIKTNETKVVKCHGNGKGRCKVTVMNAAFSLDEIADHFENVYKIDGESSFPCENVSKNTTLECDDDASGGYDRKCVSQ